MELSLGIGAFSFVGLVLIGKDLTEILFGSSFMETGNLLIILSITVLVSAWTNVIRTQYLIPSGKDKVYVTSTIIGAGINLLWCRFCD